MNSYIMQGAGIIIALILATATPGSTAEIKGIRFADRVVVNGVDLEIRGVAVLKWAMFFDVYAGAFYLPPGKSGRAWANDVRKRLELSYFRAIKARDFTETSKKLLMRSRPRSDYRRIEKRLDDFCNLFEDVKPGDRYSLTYRPGRGTELRLNGRYLGSVPGADFGEAYFGIWLGENPISEYFRDRLLGMK